MQLGEFGGFTDEAGRFANELAASGEGEGDEGADCFVLLDSSLGPDDFYVDHHGSSSEEEEDDEDDDDDDDDDGEERNRRRMATHQRVPKRRKKSRPDPLSDSAVTIFQKRHLTFVPHS